jgi:hypothetical protein
VFKGCVEGGRFEGGCLVVGLFSSLDYYLIFLLMCELMKKREREG